MNGLTTSCTLVTMSWTPTDFECWYLGRAEPSLRFDDLLAPDSNHFLHKYLIINQSSNVPTTQPLDALHERSKAEICQCFLPELRHLLLPRTLFSFSPVVIWPPVMDNSTSSISSSSLPQTYYRLFVRPHQSSIQALD